MGDKYRYDGKRVVVVGAASGMGEATARLVGARGAEIHALDVKDVSVPVARFTRVDLMDAASIAAALREIEGPVDALFSCAGLPNTFPSVDVVTVNYIGSRHLIEGMLPKIANGGAIVSIASTASMGWMERLPSASELLGLSEFEEARQWCVRNIDAIGDGYTFSKEVLVCWIMTIAPRLAERQIRINAVSPATTVTPMLPFFEQAMGKDYMDRFPKPIGRLATAAEQAEVLAFLNSDAASYVTGVNLMVDGGLSSAVLTGQIDFSKLVAPSLGTAGS